MKIEIKVTNKKYGKVDPNHGLIKCYRPHFLGNPFVIGVHGTREQVIERYKDYFMERIKTDIKFRRYINNIVPYSRAVKEKVINLQCFCHPLPCHADFIKEYLESNYDLTIGYEP